MRARWLQSLNLAVMLEDPRAATADGHTSYFCIVNIPNSFSRWYEVPPSAARDEDSWQQVGAGSM